ncbi:hypothetical protein PCE1_000024 [Barthelona sp. PCE]
MSASDHEQESQSPSMVDTIVVKEPQELKPSSTLEIVDPEPFGEEDVTDEPLTLEDLCNTQTEIQSEIDGGYPSNSFIKKELAPNTHRELKHDLEVQLANFALTETEIRSKNQPNMFTSMEVSSMYVEKKKEISFVEKCNILMEKSRMNVLDSLAIPKDRLKPSEELKDRISEEKKTLESKIKDLVALQNAIDTNQKSDEIERRRRQIYLDMDFDANPLSLDDDRNVCGDSVLGIDWILEFEQLSIYQKSLMDDKVIKSRRIKPKKATIDRKYDLKRSTKDISFGVDRVQQLRELIAQK